ncbi:MAG TPA: chloride channel protein [Bacteroidales bacterium]|nr:chloride channel protein [Bacteroidales bacterium]HPI86827.1 chloride channel protein [Bacteroidales bacterium]HPM92361.1 chloride channel protein [Bacteroidales bacterium]
MSRSTKRAIWFRFMVWQARRMNHRTFLMIISVVIGILSGISAIILKNAVHFIQELLISSAPIYRENFLYFALPAIGILLAIFFVKYVIKDHVEHGVPSILYAISRSNGIIRRHNMFSSIVTSALTVGFGGSVGLEGPTLATGAAVGSSLGQYLRLSYKDLILMMTLACAGAMAAIFKSPIAAIVFAVEVLMIDLTMASLIPLLIASVTALLTSYFFLGNAVLYPFEVTEAFYYKQIPYYLILGVFTGFISVYFTRMYIRIEKYFKRISSWWLRWISGGMILGMLIFFFPALYGEGYEAVNTCMKGDYSPLFNGSPFYEFQDSIWVVFLLFILVLFFKVVATATTFGAGGVGGIFAPSLFMGVIAGLFFAEMVNYSGLTLLSGSNFAMVGMSGVIAGVLHAPLTGIFLIAEITGGYDLIIPLMLVSTISYATTRMFVSNSVYTYQLAARGELITHDKDKTAMSLLRVNDLIETDFRTIGPDARLRNLIQVISESARNIYPVVDENNRFFGFVRLDDVRHIMFKQELYDQVIVKDIMVRPDTFVSPDDSMETVVEKFAHYDKYNLPVLLNGIYIGFVSRANVFRNYREIVRKFSED